MARKKMLTRTGLPNFLSSALRTMKLKELAEKRSKRLHILRKFIERVLYPNRSEGDGEKNKLKIEDIAPQLDLKPGTWTRLENGESCLSIEAADWMSVTVLKNFGVFVTPEWLLAEHEGDELPRIINKEPFDVYGYLKDLYKAEELSKELTDSQKAVAKNTYADLESQSFVSNMADFKKLFTSVEKDLNLVKTEKDKITTIFKTKDNTVLNKEDCTFLKSICRRLIVAAEISNEEKSTRLVLAAYFMSDLFQKVNPDSIITYVRDNKMSPIFFKGEIVGGSIVSMKSLKKADKKECILCLKNGVKIVRTIHLVSSHTIVATTYSNENTPEVFSINDIDSVAIVLFRYKNLERDGLNIELDNENVPTLIKFEDIRG